MMIVPTEFLIFVSDGSALVVLQAQFLVALRSSLVKNDGRKPRSTISSYSAPVLKEVLASSFQMLGIASEDTA